MGNNITDAELAQIGHSQNTDRARDLEKRIAVLDHKVTKLQELISILGARSGHELDISYVGWR